MSEDNKICRICLDGENEDEMITPCHCDGTMRYVHKKCLNNWLEINKDTEKYHRCSECKTYYKRTNENDNRPEAMKILAFNNIKNVAISTSFLFLFMFLASEGHYIGTFIVIFIYLAYFNIFTRYSSTLLLLLLVMIIPDSKVKFFLTCLLLLACFLFEQEHILFNRYDINLKKVESKIYQHCDTLIYDFFTKKYVEGII